MGKVIAIINQKGGVGKTTTAINLSASLSLTGRRILLIDLDPQGNATSGLNIDKRGEGQGIYHILIDDFKTGKEIRETSLPNLFLIPCTRDMLGVEGELMKVPNRERRLSSYVEKIRKDYDYIFVDSPPSLGILTMNCFLASDTLIIPIQCEYYSLEGLSDLLRVIDFIKKRVKPDIKFEGILLTMFDSRNNLNRVVVDDIIKHFGQKVFKTIIHRNIRISESQSHGKPTILYDSRCRGSEDYLKLAEEFVFLNEGKRIKWIFKRREKIYTGRS